MNNKQKDNRKLLHQRTIVASGYERENELWDLHAELTDIKTVAFPNIYRGKNNSGVIPAGDPLHGMSLQVTIDINLVIHEVEVKMPYTPYEICPKIESIYQKAVGLKIEAGFSRKISELFKGQSGCAHITELWGTIGTMAYQTLFPEFARRNFSATAKGLSGACHVHTTPEQSYKNIDAHIPLK